MLPNMVASTVWNTRAKTDVPQKTRAVRSHRTPENRFSSASVHFRTPSSSPRAKKERKRERKREREKERERHVSFISFIYPYYGIRVFFLSIFPRDFFPIFWRLLHNKHIDIIPQQRRKEGDRHACLDERRSGAVQAPRGKCRRRRRATPRVSSKARRRERDSMHAGQEEAERRVRV